jgi:NADP-dependent 3-hydroxy acid dehydrogenase YdfG
VTERLDQHIALVTGASGGIGRAISVALAMEGSDVHLVGRNADRLKLTVDLCVPLKHQVETTICDLTEEQSIRRLGSDIAQRYGRLDVLVHCAGAIGHATLEDAPVEILDQQLTANIRGPLLLTQVMLPLLKKPRGQIVFINSSAGLSSAPGRGHFTATQHALRAIADTLRQEVNADSVRVLSVYPGRTATPRVEELFAKEKRAYQPGSLLQPEDVAAVVVNALTLPWTAEVTDITIRPMLKAY